MAEQKPNPFLLPSQQIMGRGIDAKSIQFLERMNPLMRQVGLTGDVIAPWEQQSLEASDRAYQGSEQQSREAERWPTPQVQQERGEAEIIERNLRKLSNEQLERLLEPDPDLRPALRSGASAELARRNKIIEQHALREAGRAQQGPFTSSGGVTPPANIGGDPRAVSSYPQVNEYMTRDRSQVGDWDESPTRLRGMEITGRIAPEGKASYYPAGPDAGDVTFFDPIDMDLLVQRTPPPRTPAQLLASAQSKEKTGQALDAEEREWYVSAVRQKFVEAGFSDEKIQYQLSRIDPATGMIPRGIR